MVPTSILTASPFNLVQADTVVAKVTVTNAVGNSPPSDTAIQGGQTYADVRAVPHKPPTKPSRGAATSTTQIEVVIAALTGAETGGEAILSYHIEYYDPVTSAWVELQGYSSNALTLSVIKSGLTISTSY